MYRTNDPRFRRRLNEIGQTLESANESAQSGLYIFGQNYIKPCVESVSSCLTTCVDASCPSLNLSQRDRLRRQRGRARSRGRAELSFDFYDDWDEDEADGLLGGWGNDEFDRLVSGGGAAGYGTVSPTSAQPGRKQRGMTYGSSGANRGRRKSAALPRDGGPDPTVISGSSSLLSKLFGGKPLRYKPSAADLQEHLGARRLRQNLTEGEALLEENEEASWSRTHRRARSGTQVSNNTSDSYSSRGDLFPSDEEDDAVPLDDEFAMVLERRTSQSGPETESASSHQTASKERRRSQRPSTGSRTSTRRTVSTRSTQSNKMNRSRAESLAAETPIEETLSAEDLIPSLTELKHEEHRLEREEEAEVERRRQEAQRLAVERGLVSSITENAILSSKEATPENTTPAATTPRDEPSQLPTPVDTEDEDDHVPPPAQEQTGPQSPEPRGVKGDD